MLRPETIKHLEENKGSIVFDINLCGLFVCVFFFGSNTTDKDNNSENKQMKLHETKNFCRAKNTINKIKRQPTEGEEIFAEKVFKAT